MHKKLWLIILTSLIISKLTATAALKSDFFTVINTDEKFSYGFNNTFLMDFKKNNVFFYGAASITNYKNLFIPFERFDLSAPVLNIFSYKLGTGIKMSRVKTDICFFGTDLLDNSISVSILDFRLRLKNVIGTSLSINLFDNFNFNFTFFNCSPEFQQRENSAAGNLKLFYTNGIYNLQMNKVDIDFCTAFLYGYGTFDFYIPQANLILIHYIFSGNGNLQLTTFATGTKITTKNNTVNFLADFGLIYLMTAKLSVDITQTSRVLFIQSSKNIPYEKDISGLLLIPFGFEINFSAHINAIHTQASLSKSFAIPISFSGNSNLIQPHHADISGDKKNTILRTLLLSGINFSIKIDF